ncbi:hypothetical protein ACO22_07025 [Paracoccidioides brasiliensis]|uniref:Fungal STAND N-terminal Goodbye domain-containing protein n=1 Tax=Paracoccidioides brasiliensis TaxID=121759 RepID=A0A1D2J5T2_PARBR|nr:hypothetical protein ACO22_07025 [Paracoccidioides brasiliensis]
MSGHLKYSQSTKRQSRNMRRPRKRLWMIQLYFLGMASVDDLRNAIDKESSKSRDFVEKKHRFLNVLESAIKPVECVGPLLASTVSMAVSLASLVSAKGVPRLMMLSRSCWGHWRYLKLLVPLLDNKEKERRNIQFEFVKSGIFYENFETTRTLSDFITIRLRVYTEESILVELRTQRNVILAALIAIFAFSRKSIEKRQIYQVLEKMTLLHGDEKVHDATDRLPTLLKLRIASLARIQ